MSDSERVTPFLREARDMSFEERRALDRVHETMTHFTASLGRFSAAREQLRGEIQDVHAALPPESGT